MKEPKDTRIQCRHCGTKTWMKDYKAFMQDHDKPDGRKCKAAAAQIAITIKSGE